MADTTAYTLDNYTVSDMVALSWQEFKTQWKYTQPRPGMNLMEDFFYELKFRSQLSVTNVCCITLVALIFAVYRYLLIKFIVRPITSKFNFNLAESIKFNESAFRFSAYGLLSIISSYLVHVKYPQLTYHLATHWTDYSLTMPVPRDIEFLFILECGFYFFAIYATCYLDSWKKDSIAMIFHHILANCLIIFSLTVRYHRIGLIVMYLHDGADVFLEFTKLIVYMKKKTHWTILTYLSNLSFMLFAFNWFWCRLVLYPKIVLFSSLYVGTKMIGPSGTNTGSFYFSFNAMLSFLVCLNFFWFYFVILLIVRIVTGKTKDIEDTREYVENEEEKEREEEGEGEEVAKGEEGADHDLKYNGNSLCNGDNKMKINGSLNMKDRDRSDRESLKLRRREAK